MTPTPQHPGDQPLVRLPLTEATPAASLPTRTHHVTEQTIAAFVADFYARCRVDPTLGPVFEAHVTDWPDHLARIESFWRAALLKQPGYAGRPLEAHLALPSLSAQHFSTWLRLFSETLPAHCTPEDTAAIMTLAGRMANRIIASGGGLSARPRS